MPTTNTVPKFLRPYIFHGVDLDYGDDTIEAIADCPFCGREGKFSVTVKTGQAQCFVCRAGSDKGGMNAISFLRELWRSADAYTKPEHYEGLAKERRLLYPESLQAWGIRLSPLTGDWLIPGYNYEGKLSQLYRYIQDVKTKKRKLLPTPELGHQIHGIFPLEPKPEIWLCEGPWDAIVLWETLQRMKKTDEGYAPTGSVASSLLSQINLLAVPGCGSVGTPLERWLPLLAGKQVALFFDSDHPREENGRKIEPAGYSAAKRAANIMARAEESPSEVRWLKWGEEGYAPALKSGYDVRDYVASTGELEQRIYTLGDGLIPMIEPIPGDWVVGRSDEVSEKGSLELELMSCSEWRVLINSARKAVKLIEGLDQALACMLATVVSTPAVGDQLWMKVVGPASCGKSILCEALSSNKKWIVAKSTMRGFHSGYLSDREGKEDNSLLALCRNKTLVTKDGDTLLQAPNLGQILSEARDIFDRVSRTHYRHGKGKDYEGYPMTWLLCGTNSIRSIDSSELGERFLDVVVVEDMDDDLEDEIGWRVANRAEAEMSLMSNGQLESMDGPEMTEFKKLCGGYINYLRNNAQQLLSRVTMSDEAKRKCQKLAKFVAIMRARPSKRQEEKAEREMSFRLISQMVRLAKSLACVLNKDSVDEEVMARVNRVALDTARGRTLDLAKHLYRMPEGATTGALAILTNQTDVDEKKLLRFLRKIGGVEVVEKKVKGVTTARAWRLTKRLRDLYEELAAPNLTGP